MLSSKTIPTSRAGSTYVKLPTIPLPDRAVIARGAGAWAAVRDLATRRAGGRHPVTPWGQPTRGFKTRNNKRTDKWIVNRKSKKR